MLRKTIAVLMALALTATSTVVLAEVYDLPPDGSDVVGAVTTVTAREASLTWTTAFLYSVSIFTTVWAFEVVAPPINKGMSRLLRSISLARWTIS